MSEAKSIHAKLEELAHNLWWSWQPEVTDIFRQIDPHRWSELSHNAILLLKEYPEERLEKRAREAVLHSRVNWAYRRFHEYIDAVDTWGNSHAGVLGFRPVAYFSAEFGLHESLRVYSGGLGVLAGDHLKSASDLGVPLVAVGLFYNQGYFAQTIDENGWQKEQYNLLEVDTVPAKEVKDTNGKPVIVCVETRSGNLYARIIQISVGRIPLYLLDADIEQNTEENRQLTARLYGGDHRMRIRQEMLLGIGGMRALNAIGLYPRVIHMNEGHSAFAPLEVIRHRMHNDGMSFDEAMRETRNMCVFTTHTPVAAGHDRFDAGVLVEHLGPIAQQLGLDDFGILGLGRVDPQNSGELFCMTVLAFKTSKRANAVSNLHGVVSRRMWSNLWPWRSEQEIPIGHITNGVHVSTWLAPQMRLLFDRVLPANWYLHTSESEMWAGIDQLPSGELWETHHSLKHRLINYARIRLAKQCKSHGGSDAEIQECQKMLDPQALLIGFARRFAPYKRADLFMYDIEWLKKIITNTKRPVQFVFCGKAHPADDMGKSILQKIYKLTQEKPFRGKVIFLEDYDINITRHLVQGVDVWLNNPRRPLEASGTSGQKVVLNGGLNLSVLDGWWAEGYNGSNGFAIGNGDCHTNIEIQDRRDAESFRDVLENTVIPLYYKRDEDDTPQEWIKMMKNGVRTLGWRFSADRMVIDYVTKAYLDAAGASSSEMVVMP
jgi:starch phosphorylase